MIGNWRPGLSTTPFGVWGKNRKGWWLLVVMRLAHCWVLEQQDSFCSWVAPLCCGVAAGGGGRVVAGFPHMTVIMICLHALKGCVGCGGGVWFGVVV
jgi:hypothetical protein